MSAILLVHAFGSSSSPLGVAREKRDQKLLEHRRRREEDRFLPRRDPDTRSGRHLRAAAQDERTSELVNRLRDDVLPSVTRGSQANVYVGGATATLQDLADKIAGRLPIFIAMVVGLSVLLLMAVFRSLWVPLVSAAFNLLSIAAA